MSVLLETGLGDMVMDLDVQGSPRLCRNFLKLCHARYYTQTLLHHVVPHRFVVFGDRTGTGTGGLCFDAWLAAVTDTTASMKKPKNDEPHGGDDRFDEKEWMESPDEATLERRFLPSSLGRRLTVAECREKGRVVAVELGGLLHTVGSQFLITTTAGVDASLDGYSYHNDTLNSSLAADSITTNAATQQQASGFLSLGWIAEDSQRLLDRWADAYCDKQGRPFADWRIRRALVVHDPFPDPPEMPLLWRQRYYDEHDDGDKAPPKDHAPAVEETTAENKPDHIVDNETKTQRRRLLDSPSPERPVEERVPVRVPIEQVMAAEAKRVQSSDAGVDRLAEDHEEDEEDILLQHDEAAFQKELARRQDKSRAVVLELLGDLPDADVKAPENVLFVCKLNPITTDADLELICSRFDPKVRAEIVRDPVTQQSLQYAFCEFSTPQQATRAYLKLNHALVDDRRILVDFSQSVSHVWDRFRQQYRGPSSRGGGRGSQRRGGGPPSSFKERPSSSQHQRRRSAAGPPHHAAPQRPRKTGGEEMDEFGRANRPPPRHNTGRREDAPSSFYERRRQRDEDDQSDREDHRRSRGSDSRREGRREDLSSRAYNRRDEYRRDPQPSFDEQDDYDDDRHLKHSDRDERRAYPRGGDRANDNEDPSSDLDYDRSSRHSDRRAEEGRRPRHRPQHDGGDDDESDRSQRRRRRRERDRHRERKRHRDGDRRNDRESRHSRDRKRNRDDGDFDREDIRDRDRDRRRRRDFERHREDENRDKELEGENERDRDGERRQDRKRHRGEEEDDQDKEFGGEDVRDRDRRDRDRHREEEDRDRDYDGEDARDRDRERRRDHDRNREDDRSRDSGGKYRKDRDRESRRDRDRHREDVRDRAYGAGRRGDRDSGRNEDDERHRHKSNRRKGDRHEREHRRRRNDYSDEDSYDRNSRR